jgi:murein DD-endopeptidase MepM/ murein hydrolase activator NlpD
MFEKRILPVGLLVAVIAVLALVLGFAYLRVGPLPEISIKPAVQAIGKRTPIRVEVSEPSRGLSHVKVEFVQGDRTEPLADKTYETPPALKIWAPRTERDVLDIEVGRDTISGMRAGTAIIRVTAARLGTWMRTPDPAVQEISLPVRLAPPTVQIVSSQTYVAQGGSEVVVYRIGDGSVRDGVQAGDWWFPGFPLPGGGKQDRFAFFAVPYDMAQPQVHLVADDGAGNRAEVSFIDKFFPKAIKQDRIEVNDAFLGKVVPEILSQSPEIQDKGKLLDSYLEINRTLRQKNTQQIRDLAAKSQQAFLWSKTFVGIPNGKVMASFADRRTYMYQGNKIDQQDHLGFDLAVTIHAPIPAANDGIVVQARFFGIYGNCVVIDHGYGLMTLYGHMASIAVKEGQKVARGDVLGTTGQTGLAGGDHLHFTTMLQGLPVNPVEWWDSHWIQDRIAKKLGPAIKFEP